MKQDPLPDEKSRKTPPSSQAMALAKSFGYSESAVGNGLSDLVGIPSVSRNVV